MSRYALRTGEPLAISADAIRRDADGFFFLMGDAAPENETTGSVISVSIRGALQQFKGSGGDSYESIEERVGLAYAADPKPSAVLLRISSPGGLVAGLNECVRRLQRMSKEAGIPLVAYVDELAASAAYALCCACSEVLAPPSAIVGSVGVISTLISVAKADEKAGIEFQIVTSGKRKADGHLHQPISDDALRSEKERNNELAAQFFALAGKARGMAPAKLESLQAAIYLGKRARQVGLIDEVIGLDDALLGLDTSEVQSHENVAPNEGNATDRRAKESQTGKKLARLGQAVSPLQTTGDRTMSVKLSALIKKTEAAISTETDPKKLRALQANLAAFLSTRAEMDDDDGDDGDKDPDDKDDGDEGEESKSKKAAENARKMKARAEAAKHRSKAAEHKQKMAESEEAAKKCEEEASGGEEDDEDEARLRTPATSALSAGAAAAVESAAAIGGAALARIEALEKDAEKRNVAALINDARASRRITPGEAKTLGKKSGEFVRDFLSMRTKPLVNTDETELENPDTRPNADLPASVTKEIERAVTSSGLDEKGQEKLRADLLDAQRKARTNGAGMVS